MYHHPFIFHNHGQPITVMYPGHYTNITSRHALNYQSRTVNNHYMRRQYPEVDPSMFNESAAVMQQLMGEASIVLKAIAESKSFAKKIMTAAQESHLEEVERLIKSTGIKSHVDTSFNPDGINMKLSSKVGETECCQLSIALRWRS